MRVFVHACFGLALACASCRSCDACVEAADDTSASDDKLPSPWPATTMADSLAPLTVGRGFIRAALVPQSVDDVAQLYMGALAACAPTRTTLGEAVRVACDVAEGESSALLLPAPDARTLLLMRWQRPKRQAVPVPLAPIACGPALRFLAPPPEAQAIFAGASQSDGDDGELSTCAFLTSLDPGDALKAMSPRVFKATPTSTRARDDRYSVEAFDGGVYWRIDTGRAYWKPATQAPQKPVVSWVSVTRWDPHHASRWPVTKADRAARVANLEACTKPCAAAFAQKGRALLEQNDAVGLLPWSTRASRCEYACDGEPGAPPGVDAAGGAGVWREVQ